MRWNQNVKTLGDQSKSKVILHFYNFSHFLLWLSSLYLILIRGFVLLTCLSPNTIDLQTQDPTRGTDKFLYMEGGPLMTSSKWMGVHGICMFFMFINSILGRLIKKLLQAGVARLGVVPCTRRLQIRFPISAPRGRWFDSLRAHAVFSSLIPNRGCVGGSNQCFSLVNVSIKNMYFEEEASPGLIEACSLKNRMGRTENQLTFLISYIEAVSIFF